ncbi:MAG: NUDIX domain-containing protein [Candidatus Paceibacterota bacterium]
MELQVGVKIILQNKEGKYLVILRSAVKYPDAGAKWEIPGGRIISGTILLENLKREVKEETGLEIKDDPRLLTAQDIIQNQKNKHIVRLTYSGFSDGEVKLSDEHTEYKWLNREELMKLEPMDPVLKEVLTKFSI